MLTYNPSRYKNGICIFLSVKKTQINGIESLLILSDC